MTESEAWERGRRDAMKAARKASNGATRQAVDSVIWVVDEAIDHIAHIENPFKKKLSPPQGER